MGNNIWNIVRKECDRFFKDRRMVFTTIFLPAIFIYVLYTVMGAGFSSMNTVADDYTPLCYVHNGPEAFVPVFDALEFEVIETDDIDSVKNQITGKDADLLVVFPTGFDAALLQWGQGGAVPNIEVYYNSAVNESKLAYNLFLAAAEEFEASLSNVMDINRGVETADLATDRDILFTIFSTTLPMLIIVQLFSGCISVAPESISGEKERGTIATLLVTPVRRTDIAIGKIISLSLFALLYGLSSFLGIMLSLPNLVAITMPEINMNVYSPTEYICLLCVIASTVLLIVAVISVISAYAKTVKEAASMAQPLMICSTLLSMVQMFSIDFTGISWRFIPILNSVLCLNDIFAFEYSALSIAVTCVSNLVYMLIFVSILSKMFNSEKIMFSR